MGSFERAKGKKKFLKFFSTGAENISFSRSFVRFFLFVISSLFFCLADGLTDWKISRANLETNPSDFFALIRQLVSRHVTSNTTNNSSDME